jgi:hypothetical protein
MDKNNFAVLIVEYVEVKELASRDTNFITKFCIHDRCVELLDIQ